MSSIKSSDTTQFLDGVGFVGSLFEQAMVVALACSTLLVFIYLWRRGRLDMGQEAAIAMMELDDNAPAAMPRRHDNGKT